jgi:NAD(P)-dependent dehydrogenase (short-subunit alcohol dehydrogenase family)
MDLGLRGKVVIATGASEGIGKAIAIAFASEGANLVICSHSPDKLTAAHDEIAQSGGRVLAVTADLSTTKGAAALKDRTLQEFGTAHVLVNNVGLLGRLVPFMDVSDEEMSVTKSGS